MTKDEARKLAKELEGVIADVEEGDGFDDVCLDTVKYVRDALVMAQPEQEPAALVEKFSLLLWDYQELERAFEKATGGKWIRKSNTPQPEPVIDKSAAVRIATSLGWEPKRKPLTDEQWQVMADMLGCLITRTQKDAIEAIIGIKE